MCGIVGYVGKKKVVPVIIEGLRRLEYRGYDSAISIVGSSKEPRPLPDREMEALRLGMRAHKVEPHPYHRIGERVRVKSGIMAGVEGVLTRKKNEFRAVLAFDAIMHSVSVEEPHDQDRSYE